MYKKQKALFSWIEKRAFCVNMNIESHMERNRKNLPMTSKNWTQILKIGRFTQFSSNDKLSPQVKRQCRSGLIF